MTVRPDIKEMLLEGLTNAQIARHAKVSRDTVASARAELGLPRLQKRNTSHASLKDALLAQVRITPGGHWEWAGPSYRALKHQNVKYTALQAAFVVRYGRMPSATLPRGCHQATSRLWPTGTASSSLEQRGT